MKKKIIFGFLATFMILLPLSSVRAAEKIVYPFENSALLMISSQMRLAGEIESANASNGHMLSASINRMAQQDNNEIDILINLYAKQIARLRQSGNHSPELEDRLINSLEEKVDELKERAAKLVEVRRPRRRGGLGGLFKRIERGFNNGLKAIGRATGWVMGKTMESAGKVAQFGIEEVAPRVLKKAIWSTNPLGSALYRAVARDLLIKRVEAAIVRQVEKRTDRAQVVLSDEENEDIDELVDSMETKSAIEESEATQDALKDGESGQITVSFTGQITFMCNIFVGEGGDSQMMGKIPVVVNFDSGTYSGESQAYTHTRDDGQTITSTFVYQGIVSEEGILRGTWTATACGWANKDVDCIGGPNPGVGIVTDDGSGLYLYDLIESSTDMLELFQASREEIVSTRAGFMDPLEYPPTCRQR